MELHLQVREARKQAGLTQGELAARAGVGRKDLNRFENGENVTMRTFLKIVGALPNLTRLTIGQLELAKDEAPSPANDGELLRQRATEVLDALNRPPAAGSASPPATARELSLLRTLGQLLVEITGGGSEPR